MEEINNESGQVIVEESEESIKQNVLDYISTHEVCVLATSSGNSTDASTVMYASRKFDLYCVTYGDTLKVHNIKENPNIAVVIDDQDKVKPIKGLQYYGYCHILEHEIAIDFAKEFMKSRFPDFSNMIDLPECLILRIVPRKIIFMDYEKGPGHRDSITFE